MDDELLSLYFKDSDYEEDTDCYCGNCDDYTKQLRRYDTHERDSSHDHFICLNCRYEYRGYSGEWENYGNI